MVFKIHIMPVKFLIPKTSSLHLEFNTFFIFEIVPMFVSYRVRYCFRHWVAGERLTLV